jgi:hypothetical protein
MTKNSVQLLICSACILTAALLTNTYNAFAKTKTDKPGDSNTPILKPLTSEPNLTPASNISKETNQNYDPNSWPATAFIDKFDELLNTYVQNDGTVNYNKLRRKRLQLIHLGLQMNNLDRQVYDNWPKNDKLAFWINAYNIQMISIIIDNYPIQSNRVLRVFWGPKSLRHILRQRNIWTEYKFFIMNEEFTLREIETRFFRQEFNAPEAFFGISLASNGAPSLLNKAYYGYKLEKQLKEQTRIFLTSDKAFKIDSVKKEVYLSAIFESSWYGDAFIKKFGTDRRFKSQSPATRAVLNLIYDYLSPKQQRFLENEVYIVKFINYDWTLND